MLSTDTQRSFKCILNKLIINPWLNIFHCKNGIENETVIFPMQQNNVDICWVDWKSCISFGIQWFNLTDCLLWKCDYIWIMIFALLFLSLLQFVRRSVQYKFPKYETTKEIQVIHFAGLINCWKHWLNVRSRIRKWRYEYYSLRHNETNKKNHRNELFSINNWSEK